MKRVFAVGLVSMSIVILSSTPLLAQREDDDKAISSGGLYPWERIQIKVVPRQSQDRMDCGAHYELYNPNTFEGVVSYRERIDHTSFYQIREVRQVIAGHGTIRLHCLDQGYSYPDFQFNGSTQAIEALKSKKVPPQEELIDSSTGNPNIDLRSCGLGPCPLPKGYEWCQGTGKNNYIRKACETTIADCSWNDDGYPNGCVLRSTSPVTQPPSQHLGPCDVYPCISVISHIPVRPFDDQGCHPSGSKELRNLTGHPVTVMVTKQIEGGPLETTPRQFAEGITFLGCTTNEKGRPVFWGMR